MLVTIFATFVFVTDVYWGSGPVWRYKGSPSTDTTTHSAARSSSWTWLLWLV